MSRGSCFKFDFLRIIIYIFEIKGKSPSFNPPQSIVVSKTKPFAIDFAVIIGIIVGGALAAFGKYLYVIFSYKEEMYDLYKDITPMVGACYFMLNTLSALIGIFALIACWGISVPLAYLLGVVRNGGDFGIYIGMIVGYALYTIGTLILFFMTDWKKCALDAVERSKGETEDKEKLLIN